MKFCRQCNFENSVNAEHCAACGHSFTGGAPATVADTDRMRHINSGRRPDGSLPMLFGWLAFGLSVLFEILALSAEGLGTKWVAALAAGAFFSLFLVLWGVGYIVSAISFLPGKDAT